MTRKAPAPVVLIGCLASDPNAEVRRHFTNNTTAEEMHRWAQSRPEIGQYQLYHGRGILLLLNAPQVQPFRVSPDISGAPKFRETADLPSPDQPDADCEYR